MSQPFKNHSIFSKMAFGVQNFLRLRRAIKGFAFGTVLDRPESATLAVTIIPVSPQWESPPREESPIYLSSGFYRFVRAVVPSAFFLWQRATKESCRGPDEE